MQRKENRRGGKGRGSGMSFTEGRISLVVQWLRIRFPMQGKRVPPVVEELRSHIAVEQLRLHVAIIGQIAATVACGKQFFSCTGLFFKQHYICAASCRCDGCHHARCTCTNDCDIQSFILQGCNTVIIT